jgi:hypothetical protein
MLLNAYPKALGVTNNAEGTPLHLACCESNSSASLVKSLIEKQLELDISTNKYDTNGMFFCIVKPKNDVIIL